MPFFRRSRTLNEVLFLESSVPWSGCWCCRPCRPRCWSGRWSRRSRQRGGEVGSSRVLVSAVVRMGVRLVASAPVLSALVRLVASASFRLSVPSVRYAVLLTRSAMAVSVPGPGLHAGQAAGRRRRLDPGHRNGHRRRVNPNTAYRSYRPLQATPTHSIRLHNVADAILTAALTNTLTGSLTTSLTAALTSALTP